MLRHPRHGYGSALNPCIDCKTFMLRCAGALLPELQADFVITGEGKIDAQSLMGKVISGIAKRCVRANVPLIALAGGVEEDALKSHESGVSAIFSILHTPMSLEEAMCKETTLRQIEQRAGELFRLIKAARR